MEVEDDSNGPFKVFVGNIADDVEVDLIKEEFGHFGEIVDISFDIASAFISYGNKNEASTAIETMDGKEFMGEKIRVEFYIKPPKSPEVRFSGNFDNYHEEHRGYNRRQHSPDRQAFHQNDAFRDYSPPRNDRGRYTPDYQDNFVERGSYRGGGRGGFRGNRGDRGRGGGRGRGGPSRGSDRGHYPSPHRGRGRGRGDGSHRGGGSSFQNDRDFRSSRGQGRDNFQPSSSYDQDHRSESGSYRGRGSFSDGVIERFSGRGRGGSRGRGSYHNDDYTSAPPAITTITSRNRNQVSHFSETNDRDYRSRDDDQGYDDHVSSGRGVDLGYNRGGRGRGRGRGGYENRNFENESRDFDHRDRGGRGYDRGAPRGYDRGGRGHDRGGRGHDRGGRGHDRGAGRGHDRGGRGFDRGGRGFDRGGGRGFDRGGRGHDRGGRGHDRGNRDYDRGGRGNRGYDRGGRGNRGYDRGGRGGSFDRYDDNPNDQDFRSRERSESQYQDPDFQRPRSRSPMDYGNRGRDQYDSYPSSGRYDEYSYSNRGRTPPRY